MSDVTFRTGDVFLFEHDDSCISRLICRLSKSPISHAAMYFENNTIIEEGLPHIGTRSITELGDRDVHVRRYSGGDAKYEAALLAKAREYLAAKTPYSMGNLLAVGLLLIFNSWKPEARSAVKEALAAICILLAKIVDHKKTGGKHAATCSQLVYELYAQTGYRLKIIHKDKALTAGAGKNLLDEAIERTETGGTLDFLVETAARPDRDNADSASNGLDLEKICCLILTFLEDNGERNAPDNPVPLDDGMYRQIVDFASLLYEADAADDPALNLARDTALKAGVGGWASKILTYVLQNYAGFVSPGQLYTDCPELAEEIAVIKP